LCPVRRNKAGDVQAQATVGAAGFAAWVLRRTNAARGNAVAGAKGRRQEGDASNAALFHKALFQETFRETLFKASKKLLKEASEGRMY